MLRCTLIRDYKTIFSGVGPGAIPEHAEQSASFVHLENLEENYGRTKCVDE